MQEARRKRGSQVIPGGDDMRLEGTVFPLGTSSPAAAGAWALAASCRRTRGSFTGWFLMNVHREKPGPCPRDVRWKQLGQEGDGEESGRDFQT